MRADPRLPILRFAALALLAAAACGKCRAHGDAATDRHQRPRQPGCELAYVTNEDSHDLTVVDADSDSVVATITVGTRPRGVKVSGTGKRVFVALSGSPKCPPSMPDEECEKLSSDKSKDGVAVVDATTRDGDRACCPGGSDPEAFDMSADGTKIYVSNEDAGIASIVEVATGNDRRHGSGGNASPRASRWHPTGRLSGSVERPITTSPSSMQRPAGRLGRVVVGLRPRSVAFLPDGSRAYSANEAAGTVSVIDVATRTVIGTITMPRGLQADEHRLGARRKEALREQRAGRHGERDRRGDQPGNALGGRGQAARGASPSRGTAASSTPPMDRPTT